MSFEFRQEGEPGNSGAVPPPPPPPPFDQNPTPQNPNQGPGYASPPPMPPMPPMGQPNGPKNDPFAITSLVLGIVSIIMVCCCSYINIVLAPAAIVFGVLSVSRINKNPSQYKGKGMAIAGISTGAVGLVLALVAITASFFIDDSWLNDFEFNTDSSDFN